MKNAFDEFCRDLAGDPTLQHSTPDPQIVLAWLAVQLEEDGADYVISEIADEIGRDVDEDQREQVKTAVLRALALGEPATMYFAMSDALRRLVLKDAERKAESLRWIDSFLSPLREAIDHYDAIGADRRALASEHNAQVKQ